MATVMDGESEMTFVVLPWHPFTGEGLNAAYFGPIVSRYVSGEGKVDMEGLMGD